MSKHARWRSYISFDAAFAASRTWVDVSDYVQSLSYNVGRQRDLDAFQATTATVVLDNSDRRFDPLLTNGPYGAGLKPRRLFKAECSWNWLTANQASIETDTTGWAAGANTSIARSTAQAADGVASLSLTSAAAGNVSATTPTGTSGIEVIRGTPVVAMASFLSAVSVRSARVDVAFYTTAGVLISTTTGSTVSTTTSSFTQATTQATAPADGYATVIVVVQSAGAASEVHYVDKIALMPGDAGVPSWYAGGPEPMWCGYVPDWQPMYSPSGNYGEMPLQLVDALGVFAEIRLPESDYAKQVDADSPNAWYRFSDTTASGGLTRIADLSGNERFAYSNLNQVGNDGQQSFTISSPSVTPAVAAYAGKLSSRNDTTAGSNAFPAMDEGNIAFVVSDFTFACWFYYTWGSWSTNVGSVTIWTNSKRITVGGSAGNPQFSLVLQNQGGGQAEPQLVAYLHDGTSADTISWVAPSANYFGSPRHIVVTKDGTTATLYVDGVSRGTATVSGPASSWGSTPAALAAVSSSTSASFAYISEIVIKFSPLSSTRVLAHYNAGSGHTSDATGTRIGRVLDAIGWPTADRVISAGTVTVQPNTPTGAAWNFGNALQHMQALALTEQGQLYVDGAGRVVFRDKSYRFTTTTSNTSQATFGDGAGEINYASITPSSALRSIWNRMIGSRNGGLSVERTDAPSIAEYGERSPTPLLVYTLTDQEVSDMLDYILQRYASAQTRIESLELQPVGVVDLWPQVLARKIGHRVTVMQRMPDGTVAMNFPALIEGMQVNVPTRGRTVVRWFLSQADVRSYLIFDDPVFGLLDSNRFGF